MMTEACGATNCTMMEVGGATSSMMKVRGATKSNSRNYNIHINIWISRIFIQHNLWLLARFTCSPIILILTLVIIIIINYYYYYYYSVMNIITYYQVVS